MPRLTFEKWEFEPYCGPSPTVPSYLLPASHKGEETCGGGGGGGSPARGQNRVETADGSGGLSEAGVSHSCWPEPPVSLMGVNSCWGFAGGVSEGEPEHRPFPGQASYLQTLLMEVWVPLGGGHLALQGRHVPAQWRKPKHNCKFPGINQFFWVMRETLVTGLWACLNQRTVWPWFSFILTSVTLQRRARKRTARTLLNSGKFDSWTQTRNTDLNSKSYVFVFSFCSLSASLWSAFLSSTVKDRT